MMNIGICRLHVIKYEVFGSKDISCFCLTGEEAIKAGNESGSKKWDLTLVSYLGQWQWWETDTVINIWFGRFACLNIWDTMLYIDMPNFKSTSRHVYPPWCMHACMHDAH